MTKINSKYFYMFTIAIISLGLFNVGCSYPSKRIDILEEKIGGLTNSIESLKTKTSELNELKLEEKRLNQEYTRLKNKQIAIETTQKSQNNAHNRLEEGLSETRILLQEIKQNLASVEEDKNKMKTQLKELEALSKSTGVETSLTEDLLDKAIKLYRQDKFEEAITKWEEVLAHDPSKLAAKFNIEIAKDKIKEKEIHEELKALLIQRK